MNRVGKYKMRSALSIWYENTLKPIQLNKNNNIMTIKAFKGGLLGKCFQAWKEHCNKRIGQYKFKTDSINIIWNKLNQNLTEEKQRAFAIWREKTDFNKDRKRKIKRLLVKCYRHHIENGFYAWKRESTMLLHQCRIIVLKQEYAHKFFLNTIF